MRMDGAETGARLRGPAPPKGVKVTTPHCRYHLPSPSLGSLPPPCPCLASFGWVRASHPAVGPGTGSSSLLGSGQCTDQCLQPGRLGRPRSSPVGVWEGAGCQAGEGRAGGSLVTHPPPSIAPESLGTQPKLIPFQVAD